MPFLAPPGFIIGRGGAFCLFCVSNLGLVWERLFSTFLCSSVEHDSGLSAPLSLRVRVALVAFAMGQLVVRLNWLWDLLGMCANDWVWRGRGGFWGCDVAVVHFLLNPCAMWLMFGSGLVFIFPFHLYCVSGIGGVVWLCCWVWTSPFLGCTVYLLTLSCTPE